VVKPLGLGLDEKAIEAARRWTFRPAYQDGKPVDYPTTVTMSFHLVPPEPVTLEIAGKSKNGLQVVLQISPQGIKMLNPATSADLAY
jgi:hypothetical protein